MKRIVAVLLAVFALTTTVSLAQVMAPDVEMVDVESTLIAQVGYDAETQTLFIKFVTTGDTYRYAGVPQAIYDALLAAPSKGKYFAANIKGAFPFTKLMP